MTSNNRNFPRNFQETSGTCTVLNPGNFSSLHKFVLDIQPLWLEGVELCCRNQCTSNLQANFNWLLSHTNPTGVRFGGIFRPKISDNILVRI